jgi:hypothetical protein
MDYAIFTLEQLARLFEADKQLQTVAGDYQKSAEALRDKDKRHSFTVDVYVDLSKLYRSISDGLGRWGVDYKEQKKRQEKKLSEVLAALRFIESRFTDNFAEVLIENLTRQENETR